MSERQRNPIVGALMIIFGLILLAFPWFGLATIAAVLGFGLIMIGIGLMVLGIGTFGSSKGAAIAFVILGILAMIAGVGLFGNISAFTWLTSFALYLIGFISIIGGLIELFQKHKYAKPMGAIAIVLGILYVVFGSLATDPRTLSVLIGIWLIIMGISRLL